MSRDRRQQFGEEPIFEHDPLFGALREPAAAPDFSAAVLDEVEKRGVFASAKMRRLIDIARLGVFALGLGALGGMLLAKRASPEAAVFAVAQAPATRVLDAGCDRAAKEAQRVRTLLIERNQRDEGFFRFRFTADRSAPAEPVSERIGAPPSTALAAALWASPTERRQGVVESASGSFELWSSSDDAVCPQRVFTSVQTLSTARSDASLDQPFRALLLRAAQRSRDER